MLDVFEIKNLEERWKKYKRKKNIKILILILISLIIVAGGVYYFSFFIKKDITKNQNNNISTVKQKNIKATKKIKKLSKLSKAKKIYIENNITKSGISIVDKEKQSNYNIKNSDILHLDKNFLQQVYIDDNEENKTKMDSLPIENSDEKVVKGEIEQTNKKVKIIISSKKIDKLHYFKEQYKKNPRALYAILISKEYYKNKLYKKSLKWAIIANSLDSSNEDSWIIFAKNKVKLHHKNDAVNALQAYLKVNSSRKIEILLSDIKNGVFK